LAQEIKNEIFRPLRMLLISFAGLVLVTFLVSAGLTWREQTLLASTQSEMEHFAAFQQNQHQIELHLLALVMGNGESKTPREIITRNLDELASRCSSHSTEEERLFAALIAHVREGGFDSPDKIRSAHALLREITDIEARYEAAMLAEIQDATRQQRLYEIAAPLSLLAVILVLIPATRRRVVRPLEDFGRQVDGLARGDFSPVLAGESRELTLPVHRSFYQFAVRLQELELEHKEREATLQDEVRTATSALLEQQASLARAERLAATGELAASVAHELRNPLAGIQMSLTNLRDELEDRELVERVEMVVNEVDRLAHLLNGIVDNARHQPEPTVAFDLAEMVNQLIALTRYQLPANVSLEGEVQEGLQCLMPKERLRQALLNLVLNAAQAIGNHDGSIEIRAHSVGDDVEISVRDDGPGFLRELLQSGIRPFYTTGERGTGLGLAMVRRFVSDVEGKIELSNRLEGGERPGAEVKLLLPSTVHNG